MSRRNNNPPQQSYDAKPTIMIATLIEFIQKIKLYEIELTIGFASQFNNDIHTINNYLSNLRRCGQRNRNWKPLTKTNKTTTEPCGPKVFPIRLKNKINSVD